MDAIDFFIDTRTHLTLNLTPFCSLFMWTMLELLQNATSKKSLLSKRATEHLLYLYAILFLSSY